MAAPEIEWISVDDYLPSSTIYTKFKVKTREGSMKVIEQERVLIGKVTSTGFRFQTMDWQKVTHWSRL